MFGLYSAAFWLGTTVAPILGGALSTPADRYARFSDSAILKRYPFALPGIVAGAWMAISIIFSIFALEETGRPAAAGYARLDGSATPLPVKASMVSSVRQLLAVRGPRIVLAGWFAVMISQACFDAIRCAGS